MLKLKIEGREQWAFCPEAVKNFAKSFAEGEEVDIVSEKKGEELHVSRISKKGSTTTSPAASEATAPATQPSTAASTATKPATSSYSGSNSGFRQALNPDETRKIMRQSVMSSTCNAVNAVQSQIDPNSLGDYIITLFKRLMEVVEKD